MIENNTRYACLNVTGVKKAEILPPGATNMDLEKRDQNVAKVVLESLGLEPEKYRLGYTKVTTAQCRSAFRCQT